MSLKHGNRITKIVVTNYKENILWHKPFSAFFQQTLVFSKQHHGGNLICDFSIEVDVKNKI